MSVNPPSGVARYPHGDPDGFPLAAGLNRYGTHVVTKINDLGEAWHMGSWRAMVKLGDPIPEDRLAFVGWVVEAGS